jgi:hypothetical protein
MANLYPNASWATKAQADLAPTESSLAAAKCTSIQHFWSERQRQVTIGHLHILFSARALRSRGYEPWDQSGMDQMVSQPPEQLLGVSALVICRIKKRLEHGSHE